MYILYMTKQPETRSSKMEATTAIIKRRPGGNTSLYRWHYKVYVDGKVCRNHRILGGYPIVEFCLKDARSIAVTESDDITHIYLDWCGRLQEVA